MSQHRPQKSLARQISPRGPQIHRPNNNPNSNQFYSPRSKMRSPYLNSPPNFKMKSKLPKKSNVSRYEKKPVNSPKNRKDVNWMSSLGDISFPSQNKPSNPNIAVPPSAFLLFPSPTTPITRTPHTLRQIIDDSGFRILRESPLSAKDSYYARDIIDNKCENNPGSLSSRSYTSNSTNNKANTTHTKTFVTNEPKNEQKQPDEQYYFKLDSDSNSIQKRLLEIDENEEKQKANLEKIFDMADFNLDKFDLPNHDSNEDINAEDATVDNIQADLYSIKEPLSPPPIDNKINITKPEKPLSKPTETERKSDIPKPTPPPVKEPSQTSPKNQAPRQTPNQTKPVNFSDKSEVATTHQRPAEGSVFREVDRRVSADSDSDSEEDEASCANIYGSCRLSYGTAGFRYAQSGGAAPGAAVRSRGAGGSGKAGRETVYGESTGGYGEKKLGAGSRASAKGGAGASDDGYYEYEEESSESSSAVPGGSRSASREKSAGSAPKVSAGASRSNSGYGEKSPVSRPQAKPTAPAPASAKPKVAAAASDDEYYEYEEDVSESSSEAGSSRASGVGGAASKTKGGPITVKSNSGYGEKSPVSRPQAKPTSMSAKSKVAAASDDEYYEYEEDVSESSSEAGSPRASGVGGAASKPKGGPITVKSNGGYGEKSPISRPQAKPTAPAPASAKPKVAAAASDDEYYEYEEDVSESSYGSGAAIQERAKPSGGASAAKVKASGGYGEKNPVKAASAHFSGRDSSQSGAGSSSTVGTFDDVIYSSLSDESSDAQFEDGGRPLSDLNSFIYPGRTNNFTVNEARRAQQQQALRGSGTASPFSSRAQPSAPR